MKNPTRGISAVLFSLALAHSAVAEPPRVVATVAPAHSLASALMTGAGTEPALLVGGRESPHHFHLRPSGAALLEQADVVFWVSRSLEHSLAKPIASRVRPGAAVELLTKLDPDSLLYYEEGEGHDHGHGHEDEDADAHDDHGHEGSAEHHDEDGHAEGGEVEYADPHIWLSPALAGEMAAEMAAVLIQADGGNADLYRRNLESLRGRLAALDMELRGMLSDLPPLRAFVFHDAYGYFERAYGLRLLGGSILGGDAESHGGMSAGRVAALRTLAESEKIRCVFAEPQFDERALTPIMRGFEMEVLILDPLGADFPPGADSYFQTMRKLAQQFAKCAG